MEPSSSGSSQPTMAHVDAESAAALAAAELRVRRNAQTHMRDVPRFRIGVNADKRSFHRFMLQRYRRMLEIRSMLFAGRPVTPPRVIGHETFHIVEIVGPGGTVLELLFREWDLYLVAFRPRGIGAWFMFQGEQLPEWFGQVLTIPYSCRYSKRIARVVLKRQICEDIFYTLGNYTEENCNVQNDQRERAITAAILFFAEPGRERSSQEIMEYILELEYGEQELGNLLDKRIHAWAGLSRDTFRHEIEPKADPCHLKRAESLSYTILYEKDGEKTYESWDLAGKNGDLLILKFDTKYALPVIIKQQKEAAKAAALWQPREKKLDEISSMLEAHISPKSNQTQNRRQLKHCSQFPDFSNYLVFLLTRGEGRSFEVRQAAGLLLKNNLPLAFSSLAPSSLEYIKLGLLPFIGATNKTIRSTVGTVISVVFQIVRVAGWIELFQALEQCLESKNLNRVKGAMDAIYKICEHVPEELFVDSSGLFGPPVNVFMPIFLKFFQSARTSVRILALGCINQFIVVKPSVMHVFMDQCIQGLLDLVEDPSADVRRLVCSAWVQLIKSWPAALAPHLPNVTKFVLNAHKDPDNKVAIEACEFWIAYCNVGVPLGGLREFLPCLIPILVSNIVYAADDEYLCDAKDLKPRFHASRLYRSETKQSNDDTDAVSTWNLRKYSMTVLSVLSSVFGDIIVPSLMPMVQKDDDAWKEREAAILSIGTIAERCFTGSYPQLLQMLVPLFNDKCPHVRAITCWTLSQYSKPIVQGLVHANGREQFNEILMGLLKMMVDTNERVQESACSALAMLVEEAAEELVPQLEIILQYLVSPHGKCQIHPNRRNLRTLGTLADAVGAKLNQAKYIDVFMPPLIKKLQQLPDSNRDLLPLLECFTSIAEAVGPGFSSFAQAVFERCISFIQSRQFAKVNHARGGVSCNKELTIYSLDLLSGLTEGLGASIEILVAQSNLRELLLQCCMDKVADVRQSAMALLGELSKVCPTYLHPHLQEFLAVAAKQLNPQSVKDDVSVACNACWSIGELAMKYAKEISPVAETVIKFLVPVLKKPPEGLYKALVENSAITLGRICWVCPDIAVSRMRHFLQAWCKALCTMGHDSAKEDAFHGLCAIVEADLSEALDSLAELCDACASLKEIRADGLEDNMCRILNLLKQTTGAEAWEQCMSTLDETVVDKLGRFRV